MPIVAQDGLTVQQPVLTNPSDGVTHGGNQFKVNEYGVILGNVGTGGSVDVRARFWFMIVIITYAHAHARQRSKHGGGQPGCARPFLVYDTRYTLPCACSATSAPAAAWTCAPMSCVMTPRYTCPCACSAT